MSKRATDKLRELLKSIEKQIKDFEQENNLKLDDISLIDYDRSIFLLFRNENDFKKSNKTEIK
jgi:hypothetical protein